jgi:hypothetical protein
MERGHEAETQESSAVALGRLGGLVRSGAKRGANRKGGLVKSRKKRIAARQRASSTPRSPQEIIAAMIASIRARFGNRVIGLGHQEIRFAGHLQAAGRGRCASGLISLSSGSCRVGE